MCVANTLCFSDNLVEEVPKQRSVLFSLWSWRLCLLAASSSACLEISLHVWTLYRCCGRSFHFYFSLIKALCSFPSDHKWVHLILPFMSRVNCFIENCCILAWVERIVLSSKERRLLFLLKMAWWRQVGVIAVKTLEIYLVIQVQRVIQSQWKTVLGRLVWSQPQSWDPGQNGTRQCKAAVYCCLFGPPRRAEKSENESSCNYTFSNCRTWLCFI